MPFMHTASGPRIAADIAAWARELARYCDRLVLLSNSSEGEWLNEPLPDRVELVDLGPLQPHWKRVFGGGCPRKVVAAAAADLDAVIVQGPTSLLPAIGRAVHPALAVYFLVGFWTPPLPHEFKTHGRLKSAALSLMMAYSEREHRRVFREGVLTGNNRLMRRKYEGVADFSFITHSPVPASDITTRMSFAWQTPVRLLSIGRVDPEKHLETLIYAAARLDGALAFELDIVGPGGPAYRASLERLVESSGIAHRVRLHDGVPPREALGFYRRADCLIFHTGGTEGLPRVILEAFSQGVPVVASAYPGARETLGSTVLFYESMDVDGLVAQILRLSADEGLRAALASRGEAFIREHTLESSSRELVDVIRRSLAARGRTA